MDDKNVIFKLFIEQDVTSITGQNFFKISFL